MTALYFRKFLLKTLNMPGKGFDSLLRPNNAWQEEKQLPTSLRGNLVDYYMDLSEEEKKSLEGLKQALERKAGIKKDLLVARVNYL